MQQQTPPNPYDFIVNPSQPPKKPMLGGSLKSRIIIVVGGLVVLVIIFSIVSSILSSAGKSANQALKAIVAQQQEINRIAELGAKNATSVSGRSFATTVQLSVGTSQQQLTSRLSELGIKISKAELEQKKDSKVDTALEAAAANNRYDEAMREALTGKINTYLRDLQSSYNQTKSQKTKTVLSSAYTSGSTLLDPTEDE